MQSQYETYSWDWVTMLTKCALITAGTLSMLGKAMFEIAIKTLRLAMLLDRADILNWLHICIRSVERDIFKFRKYTLSSKLNACILLCARLHQHVLQKCFCAKWCMYGW